MLAQRWLNRDIKNLFGVTYTPPDGNVKGAAILLAGFSLPSCDLDYFMSKLARCLARSGFYVLQLDPTGHGDSRGDLEEVTLDCLRDDLEIGFEFIRSYGAKVFGISRGLLATLLAEYDPKPYIEGIVGINPYCLDPELVKTMWGNLEPGMYECAKLVPGSEYSNITDFDQEKVAFFESLGARIRNLHGQFINTALFRELETYSSQSILRRSEKGLWFFTAGSGKTYRATVGREIQNYIPLLEYYQKALVRDPLWQYQIIEDICQWMLKRIEE